MDDAGMMKLLELVRDGKVKPEDAVAMIGKKAEPTDVQKKVSHSGGCVY